MSLGFSSAQPLATPHPHSQLLRRSPPAPSRVSRCVKGCGLALTTEGVGKWVPCPLPACRGQGRGSEHGATKGKVTSADKTQGSGLLVRRQHRVGPRESTVCVGREWWESGNGRGGVGGWEFSQLSLEGFLL